MKQTEPLVSIIVPAYNSGKYLGECLNSALNQTYRNIEIIVIDDGSTDDTSEALKPYLDKIRYYKIANSGPARARNEGIKKACGRFIAFLDSDDIFLPEKIEAQLKAVSVSEKVGMVTCNGYLINERGDQIGQIKLEKYPDQDSLIYNLHIRNVLNRGCSSMLLRKECFEKAGLMDETLVVGEDWDLWLRILQNYQIRYLETPLFKYRVRAKSISSPHNEDIALKSDLRVLAKVHSGKSWREKGHLKAKAYSYRYFCAAWAYHQNGNRKKAFFYILKSLGGYPLKLPVPSARRIGIFVKIFFGENIFRLGRTLTGSLKPALRSRPWLF